MSISCNITSKYLGRNLSDENQDWLKLTESNFRKIHDIVHDMKSKIDKIKYSSPYASKEKNEQLDKIRKQALKKLSSIDCELEKFERRITIETRQSGNLKKIKDLESCRSSLRMVLEEGKRNT